VSIFMEPCKELLSYAESWTQKAQRTGGKPDSTRLFGSAKDDVIIPMIHEALQSVTGNKRVHYYSLRHSFASWTLTRLLLSDLPEIPNLFSHLPLTTQWLQDSKQFRRRLYGNDRVDNDHAWAVATLMGHSSPSVSFASYCHTLDILLPEFLKASRVFEGRHRERLRLSITDSRSGGYEKVPAGTKAPSKMNVNPIFQAVANLGSLSESLVCDSASAASLESKTGAKTARLVSERTRFALEGFRIRYPGLASKPVQLKPALTRSWLEETWALLHMSTKPDRECDRLADFLGVDLAQAKEILSRGDEICSLQSVTLGQNRHSIVSGDAETNGESGVKNRCFPQRPDAKALAIADQLALQITDFVQRKGHVARTILDYYGRNVHPDSAALVFTLGSAAHAEQSCKPDAPKCVKGFCDTAFKLQRKDLVFEGRDGTNSRTIPVTWYKKWGLEARPTCKIISCSGKRSDLIAPGEWLAITPCRAFRNGKVFERTFFDAYRFVMLMASTRFGTSSGSA